MKKILFILCCLLTTAAFAQPSSSSLSLTPVFSPPANTLTATCTSTCPVIAINGLSVATVTFSGTNSALTAQILVSPDNINFSAATLNPVAGGARTQTVLNPAAAVTYMFSVAGMTRIKESVTVLTGTNVIIKITSSGSSAFASNVDPLPADPCQDKAIQKQVVPITGTAPNTVKAIPLTAGKQTYVCELSVITGTSATSVTVSAGTGTTCGTSNVPLTGAMGITVGAQLRFGSSAGTVFGPSLLPSANDVCVAVAGGTAGYAGVATYVQQ